ncbi:hypothetical protein G7K_3289-t1 [Saitoella complicata NRRL Y-17804]|uniref:Uncharacterized protein n=1 Tax=Saitoella complicata (strain BCRC 22490 / CBS 7301 / JCM 7358 / NBRC 10748 / NRRL Y-17804) TaxID=698492 RepID=A0A0E9NHH5_SAICN|nr:hypothetical protein G7K_3289-t1 [Saitoella complicata NRRL Y-17804]
MYWADGQASFDLPIGGDDDDNGLSRMGITGSVQSHAFILAGGDFRMLILMSGLSYAVAEPSFSKKARNGSR